MTQQPQIAARRKAGKDDLHGGARLPSRIINSLKREGIDTWESVRALSDGELLRMPGIWQASLRLIREAEGHALDAPQARALPKPQLKPQIPHPEDFEAWAQHPVTRFVATAWANAAQAQQDVWLQLSWGAGNPDPEKLIEYRTRADAYRAFLETPLERYASLIEKA